MRIRRTKPDKNRPPAPNSIPSSGSSAGSSLAGESLRPLSSCSNSVLYYTILYYTMYQSANCIRARDLNKGRTNGICKDWVSHSLRIMYGRQSRLHGLTKHHRYQQSRSYISPLHAADASEWRPPQLRPCYSDTVHVERSCQSSEFPANALLRVQACLFQNYCGVQLDRVNSAL